MTCRVAWQLIGWVALAACSGRIDPGGAAQGRDAPATPGGAQAGSSAEPSAPARHPNAQTAGTGAAGAPGEPMPPEMPLSCAQPAVAEMPLRRLTRSQYAHAVRDLLQVAVEIEPLLPEDERLSTFRTNVIAPVSTLDVEHYLEAAERVAAEAVRDVGALVDCDRAALGDAECAARFIARTGRLAHRGPLAAGEQSAYEALFARHAPDGFAAAISAVIEAMLQSPAFLYQLELPGASDPAGAPSPLAPYEVAARLALFLWNSIPDDALLDAAERGELATREQVTAQARRMLADPRARDAVAAFHLQWLGVDRLLELRKDEKLFPDYDAALARAMLDETAAFASHVLLDGDHKLATLLTSAESFAPPSLRALYGIDTAAQGPPFALDPAQRAGLLTHASFLAAHAHANQSAPVLRGKAIRANLLCAPPSPPPADVNTTPPDPAPDATTRERFAAHTKETRCAGCHTYLDPIGFGFEHYDAVGRFRERDQGMPVDATGEIFASEDADGPFDGAIALAHRLADSDQVRRCVSTQWLQYALGRGVADADRCSLAESQRAFADAGHDLQELLVAISATDSFRLRKAD